MSDSNARPPHAVLLREPARFDALGLAGALALRSKLSAETLLPVVRRSWGILAEPSAAEEAEALAAALTKEGRRAVAVPASLIEPPPPALTVTKAELTGDGFDIVAGRSGAKRERLSWSHLKVLSAGAISERHPLTASEGPSLGARSARLGLTMAAGLPMLGGKRKTRQVAQERRTSFIELLFVEPLRRVRLLAGEFDYAALGPKMSFSAELNFRALVCELAARAPAALRGKGARAILAKAPSGELAYESFEDAEREERWLLALAVLGAAL